jgi:hypothetical protein
MGDFPEGSPRKVKKIIRLRGDRISAGRRGVRGFGSFPLRGQFGLLLRGIGSNYSYRGGSSLCGNAGRSGCRQVRVEKCTGGAKARRRHQQTEVEIARASLLGGATGSMDEIDAKNARAFGSRLPTGKKSYVHHGGESTRGGSAAHLRVADHRSWPCEQSCHHRLWGDLCCWFVTLISVVTAVVT